MLPMRGVPDCKGHGAPTVLFTLARLDPTQALNWTDGCELRADASKYPGVAQYITVASRYALLRLHACFQALCQRQQQQIQFRNRRNIGCGSSTGSCC